MSEQGALLFARYAYPPNELGYCGPPDASALLRADATAGIEGQARQFEGAWCYLEFLAESAGLPDPLDERVVEAYWIGNDLLDKTDPAALLDRMLDRFRGQLGGTWREAADRALAHHSFQVFDVYPWARMLRAAGNPTALSVLDQCRIRTGVVLAVDGESAAVESRPLTWDGHAMLPGPPRREAARWSTGGRSLIARPRPGDRVALHWDWVCDVITEEQAARVEALEARHHRAHHRA
ncbi:hypothetical protein GA0115240_10045 [Streptomyces sp. DvalAA-14]|uniref:DUF6390 family protein n=1 Tax=unclassified Streptomyces TaxID=2593676 RepID=UPI00081B3A18|nr:MULTISPECIES: DUF6390 family protein [unclassified Streptomyces]MYS18697.1 hypothetical protein [Streptomyces sp. SID4948]SCD27791.1 hypothetical protein GA0115240_10045 [Streptomyces sp. DvalAA-14]